MSGVADRRVYLAVIAALALSLAMRLFALWLGDGVRHVGDPENYLNLAHSIANGTGLSLPREGYAGIVPTAQFPPLYPLLLGLIAKFVPLTESILVLVHTDIDAVAAVLLHRLALRMGYTRAALPAALAYMCWPSIALMAPIAYKEGLMIALLLGLLLGLVRLAERPSAGRAVVAGVLAGALLLTQPVLAPLVPMLFILFLIRSDNRPRWVAMTLLAAVVTCAMMLPWWVRNFRIFGQFIPLTTSGGLALWVGAQPPSGMKWMPAPAQCYAPNEIIADQQLRACAGETISADPLGYLLMCLAKLPKSFFLTNWAVDQLVLAKGQPWPSLRDSLLLRVGPMLLELGALALAVTTLLRRPRALLAMIFWLAIAQILLFGIWFEFSERHRLFLTPLILILAAAAICKDRLEPKAGSRH